MHATEEQVEKSDASANGTDVESSRLVVALVISNLEYGGAQRQVVQLANMLHRGGHDAHVVSLSEYTPLASDLTIPDGNLHYITKRFKLDLTVPKRLAKLSKRLGVDVCHTFLMDAEIAGRLAGFLYGGMAVVGSERNTDYRMPIRHSLPLRLTDRLFDAIIANSNSGRNYQMRRLGIDGSRIHVVHNGVDTSRFAPQSSERVRSELGVAAETPVVGMFASFKKQKNHSMLFRVARRVRDVHPSVRFLCVGDELHRGLQDSDGYRQEMARMIQAMDLGETVMCLGNRDDVVDLYNACDVTILTSSREGTPNVVLESLSCGVPVVVTDVSDNSIVVPDGRVGRVVDYDDHDTMAECVSELLSDTQKRRMMSDEARLWVEQEFSLAALRDKTLEVYRQAIARKQGVS